MKVSYTLVARWLCSALEVFEKSRRQEHTIVKSSGEIIGPTPLGRTNCYPVDDRRAFGRCRSTNEENCDHFEVCEAGLEARAIKQLAEAPNFSSA